MDGAFVDGRHGISGWRPQTFCLNPSGLEVLSFLCGTSQPGAVNLWLSHDRGSLRSAERSAVNPFITPDQAITRCPLLGRYLATRQKGNEGISHAWSHAHI